MSLFSHSFTRSRSQAAHPVDILFLGGLGALETSRDLRTISDLIEAKYMFPSQPALGAGNVLKGTTHTTFLPSNTE